MKRGELLKGIVSETKFPNTGTIRLEKDVYVKGVINGQEVLVRVTKNRTDSCKAELVEVLRKSTDETLENRCKNFGICGGCFYQNVAYKKQLEIKEKHVKNLLKNYVTNFDDIIASPVETEYRNKMELSFGDECKGGKLSLGLHKKKAKYDILDVDDCILMNEDFRKIRTVILEYCIEKNLSYYHKTTHNGYLRYLVLREGTKTGEILIDIVTSSQNEHDFSDIVDLLKKLKLEGEIVGILHTITDTKADAIKEEATNILYGKDWYNERLFDLNFKVSIFSFFQTNTKGAENLYSKVIEYIGNHKDKIVFDLYSGTGTISQIVARSAKKVVGIEIVSEAVDVARKNAELNGLNNCTFIGGDVLKVIDEVEEKPDIIIVDPPRDGIHPKALDKIIDYGVDNIIYISCKPTSLKRDLEIFCNKGYVVDRACCVDMFPMTVHVETVALLSKLDVDKHIDVEIKLDELDLTSAESKATYAQIKEYILEKFGFKVSSLYISQIKKKYGFEMRQNYNKSKKGDQVVPQCPEEKEKAIVDALKHFKMI